MQFSFLFSFDLLFFVLFCLRFVFIHFISLCTIINSEIESSSIHFNRARDSVYSIFYLHQTDFFLFLLLLRFFLYCKHKKKTTKSVKEVNSNERKRNSIKTKTNAEKELKGEENRYFLSKRFSFFAGASPAVLSLILVFIF